MVTSITIIDLFSDIIVGTSTSIVKILLKFIIVVIKIITWGMVMMIWITIRFVIMSLNSRMTVGIYTKQVVIVIIVIVIIVVIIIIIIIITIRTITMINVEIYNITVQPRLIVRAIIKGVVNMVVLIIIRRTIITINFLVTIVVTCMIKVIIIVVIIIKHIIRKSFNLIEECYELRLLR